MTFKELTKKHIDNENLFSNLEKYVEMIEEKNAVMNLTGFKGDKLWEEGIYESILALEQSFDNVKSKKLLDIGAGVGFPSVPFKIVHPEVDLYVYEPTLKRVKFLQSVSDELELDIKIENVRAEDSETEQEFDLITARAVTALPALIEISSRIGKIGAKYSFIKGPRATEEIDKSKKIIHKLGISVISKKVNISLEKDIYLVIFDKKKETPKGIPRNWAQIAKK